MSGRQKSSLPLSVTQTLISEDVSSGHEPGGVQNLGQILNTAGLYFRMSVNGRRSCLVLNEPTQSKGFIVQ